MCVCARLYSCCGSSVIMPKVKSEWVCSECGDRFPRSLGRCTSCGTWGSLVEQIDATATAKTPRAQLRAKASRKKAPAATGVPINATQLPNIAQDTFTRIASGYGEFDRVLGGGIVPGSLVLIGGDPGVGKST